MRKQLQLLLLSTFLFSFVTTQLHAETSNWSSDVSEITPEGNIYKVTTAAQLAWIAQEVNKGNLTNKVFILQNDIDLQGKEWTPIGNSSKKFIGYFRGDSHTISNLTITELSSDYAGLFGNTGGDSGQSSEISDLNLTGVNIQNISWGTGALIGNSRYTNVKNCHVKGSVSTLCGNPVSVGGLIGYAQSAVVDGSSADITFTVVDSGTKQNYYSLNIGGIAGSAVSGITIRNSYSAGEIKRGTDDWNNNSLSTFNAGGLIGRVTEYYNYIVANSFSTCSINLSNFSTQSNSTEISAGGLVGYVNSPDNAEQSAKVAFSNSFYNGTITPLATTSTAKSNNVGTIAGNGNSKMTFGNSFYPASSTAIGDNAPSSTVGLAEIPDDLTTKLNEWVQTNNAKGEYLAWETGGEEDGISLVPEALPEADTDYAWEGDICTLKTKKGMLWFADQVNKLYNTFAGKTVKLAEGDWDISEGEWTPIGLIKTNLGSYFSGTFEGNNQTVTFKIGTESDPVNSTYQGFFGSVVDGKIQDLTVKGYIYNKSGNSGIVAAKISGGSISNVTSEGLLSAAGTSVAGIAGYTTGCDITDCVNEATVTVTGSSSQATGGIVGAFLNGKIENCMNSGSITGVAAVGGVIGRSESNAVISDCGNFGDIQASGSLAAGGVIGMLNTSSQCDEDVIVINAINKGQVSLPNGQAVGGIVGMAGHTRNDKKEISFVNCGNLGDISGSSFVGGIGTIQMTTGKSISVENCFNTGGVVTSGYGASLILRNGSSGTATLKNSFYKEQDGLSSAMGTVDNTENISKTTDDGSWLNQLNQYVEAYNSAHPDGPQAKTWKFDADGNPVFGLPAPVIEGETSFTSWATVTITATGGASIYYTTDGSNPAVDNGTLYTGSFTLTATTTVKAVAVQDDKTSDPAEKTFTYIYVPPVIPTYYTVTLPDVEGVTLSRKAGDYTVEEGYSFSFRLTLNEGYEQSQPVVKANGIEIKPRQSDGKYVVRYIEEDILITIEGIVKDDPTANATIGEKADRIYSLRNVVYIESPVTTEAQVISIGGRVVRQLHIVPGTNRVADLPAGVYVVRLSDGKSVKVNVR